MNADLITVLRHNESEMKEIKTRLEEIRDLDNADMIKEMIDWLLVYYFNSKAA